MNKLIPDHLLLYSIEADTAILPVNQSWIKSLGVRLKLVASSSGSDKFQIRFSGERYNDGLLGPEGKMPLAVYAITGEGREVLIFDQRKHGFESILNETKEFDAPVFRNYIDPNGEDKFRIYFFSNSSIDFDDEFERNKDGLIDTLTDGLRSLEWLRANAFDYIVVFLENKKRDFTKLIELELV